MPKLGWRHQGNVDDHKYLSVPIPKMVAIAAIFKFFKGHLLPTLMKISYLKPSEWPSEDLLKHV